MKAFFLLAAAVTFGTASHAQFSNRITAEDETVHEAKAKTETKINVVKLYSKKEKGTVVITSHRAEDVQLYIFDLEGTIMHQSTLKTNEKKKVESLNKGTYTYTIFSNDESVEEGKLVIK